jgi:four helix bundle protein
VVPSPIRDFRDLLVWQEAIELALLCDTIADQLPRRQFKLAGQIRRSANTVHAAIAEGNGSRTSANYLRYLGISDSSLNEVRSHMEFVVRRYPGTSKRSEIFLRLDRVDRLLAGLIKAIERKRREDQAG